MSILEFQNVSKSFGGVCAVDNLSLGFDEGKITALIGPNGAGKTTIFNLMSGFLRPDTGAIRFSNENIAGLTPWQIAGKGLGRLFQDVRLFDRLTVMDNVMSAFRNQAGESIASSLLMRSKVKRQERIFTDEARRLLTLVSMDSYEYTLAENLSYGQQKLVAIARLLAAKSEVLLLDEPTAGVNPQIIRVILEVIKRMAGEGKTIIVIEHNMNVVMEIADWICFLDEGQVASFGLPNEVLGDPEVRRAYVGL